MKTISIDPIPSGKGPDAQRRGFIHNRMQNFGWTLVVMGGSFILYYLGFFGGIEGPLQPDRIGDRLAALGFTDRRLLMVLLSFTLLALTWNWIYNAVNRSLGLHMHCTFRQHNGRNNCGAPVLRKISDRRAGRFFCTAGHVCARAQVRIVKKGTVGHFLWMMGLVFSAIVIYLS